MKKYILFLLIIFLSSPVYASEFNMNSHTSATLDGTKNRYLGTEIYNTGTSNTYTFGTRYNGKLSAIDTYFDYPFEQGTTYRLTYNMNTEDFRNNFGGKYWWDCSQTMNATNQHLGTFTYVSYKKVQFTFTPTENTTCIRVLLGSTNLSSTAITGVSNWRLDSITLYDPDYQTGSGGGQGTSPTPSPTPSGASNQDIINNQTNNTQDIINNNNENTNNIIENNNENTDKITDAIENQNKNCKVNLIDFTPTVVSNPIAFTSTYEGNNLNITSSGGSTGRIQYKIKNIKPNTTYTVFYSNYVSNTNNSIFRVRAAVGTDYYGTWLTDQFPVASNQEFTFNSGNNTEAYLWFYILDNTPINISIYDLTIYNPDYCIDTQQQQVDAINDLNDTMKDDNIDDNTGFFTGFTNNMHGLSSIITIPLTTIQSLANTSCVALTLPIPFTNDTIDLPCMSQLYDTHAHDIYYLWQIVSFGIISYYICLDIFKMVKGFKDPNEDKIEVLDL